MKQHHFGHRIGKEHHFGMRTSLWESFLNCDFNAHMHSLSLHVARVLLKVMSVMKSHSKVMGKEIIFQCDSQSDALSDVPSQSAVFLSYLKEKKHHFGKEHHSGHHFGHYIGEIMFFSTTFEILNHYSGIAFSCTQGK